MRQICHPRRFCPPRSSAASTQSAVISRQGIWEAPYAQQLVIPSGFAVWNASPDLKFGLAITVPFGARIAYSPNLVGRYQSVVSSLTDVQISLGGCLSDR